MATRNSSGRADHESIVSGSGPLAEVDAVELLKADHRRMADCLAQVQATQDAARKEALVAHLCNALEVHARIEEEIFYPAYVDAGGAPALCEAAIEDHATTRQLIMQVRHSSGVADAHFDARLRDLIALFNAHTRDEERSGGLFEQAEAMGMDLDVLGPQMQRRRDQLLDEAATGRAAAAQESMPDQAGAAEHGCAGPR